MIQKRRPMTMLCPRPATLLTSALPETVDIDVIDVGEHGFTCYVTSDGPLKDKAAFFPWSSVGAVLWDVET